MVNSFVIIVLLCISYYNSVNIWFYTQVLLKYVYWIHTYSQILYPFILLAPLSLYNGLSFLLLQHLILSLQYHINIAKLAFFWFPFEQNILLSLNFQCVCPKILTVSIVDTIYTCIFLFPFSHSVLINLKIYSIYIQSNCGQAYTFYRYFVHCFLLVL